MIKKIVGTFIGLMFFSSDASCLKFKKLNPQRYSSAIRQEILKNREFLTYLSGLSLITCASVKKIESVSQQQRFIKKL